MYIMYVPKGKKDFDKDQRENNTILKIKTGKMKTRREKCFGNRFLGS